MNLDLENTLGGWSAQFLIIVARGIVFVYMNLFCLIMSPSS
jgi:hypothetical protein